MNSIRPLWISILFWIFSSICSAQDCPQQAPTGADLPSRSVQLKGNLQFHDGIRKWFELRLAAPVCKQQSVQIVAEGSAMNSIETLRGCNVVTEGKLDIAGTGYFSRDIFQSVVHSRPTGNCARKAAFPETEEFRPAGWVRRYQVEMHVDYRPGDHPVVFRVMSNGKELRPWQAYASYQLTGGFVLYGFCGKGFEATRAFGTHEAKPTLINTAGFDPEAAASAGVYQLSLGYDCERPH